MAYELELSARFDGLLSGFQEIKKLLSEVKQAAEKSGADLGKTFQTASRSVSLAGAALSKTASELPKVTAGTQGITDSFTESGQAVHGFTAEIQAALNESNQLADAAIQDAEQYTQGSSQKQVALQKEIAELQRLQQLSKAANNPESAKEFTRVIEQQAAKVRQLANELTGKKTFEITLPDGTVRNVSSMRSLLREAEEEAFALGQKFGFTSEQAVEARRRVGEFRDAINDARAGAEAFNPDKKFLAASQALNALLGGFTALQGALGIIGVEGEDAQRALVKIQGALAISQGLSQLLNLSDAIKNIRSVLGLTTAATVANTVAQETNTAATAANATTQGIFTRAVVASSAAVRGLTAALITNPFTAALVAITALVAAFTLFGDESKKTKESIEDMLREIDKIKDASIAEGAFRKDLSDINRQIREIGAGDDFKKRKQLVQETFRDELRFIFEQTDAINFANEQLFLKRARLSSAILNMGDAEAAETRRQLAQIDDAIDKNLSSLDALARERARLPLQQQVELKRLQKEETEFVKKQAEERKRSIIQANQEVFKLQEELQKKSQQSQLENLTGESRIIAERQIAFSEVQEFERSLRIKERLAEESNKKISEQRLTKLIDVPEALRTDEQKAEIDKLIAEVKLKTKDVAAIGVLLDGVERSFSEKLTEFYRSQSELRAELITDTTTREAELFRIGLERRITELRKAGLSEDELVRFQEQQRKAFAQRQKLTAIETQEKISISEIEAIKTGKNEILRTETDKQIAILNVQLFYAQERLAAIEQDTTKEGEVQRAALKAYIAKIQKDISDAKTQIGSKPITWADIFNFEGTEEEVAQFHSTMDTIAQNIVGITNQLIASAQAGVQAQIAANQEIINSIENRISQTQSAIEREEELNRQGIANNLNAKRAELDELKRQRIEAIESQKRLQAEQQRIARIQIIADSAQQASSLTTAAANLIKTWSTIPFGTGLAAAFALITSMVATFLSIKGRVESASQPKQSLGAGGRIDYGLIKGRSHQQGGIEIGNTGIFVEGNEYVTNKTSTQKYYPLLEAINRDNFSGLSATQWPDFPTMALSQDMIDKISAEKKQAKVSVMVEAMNTKGIMDGIGLLHGTVKEAAGKIIDREKVTYLPDGTKIILSGNVTKVIRQA